jgi:GTP cyclohydrolase FolE2
MPDIAQRPLEQRGGTLDWVGMSEIHQPVKIEHHESLHAHNAVSMFTKGVEAGRQSPE